MRRSARSCSQEDEKLPVRDAFPSAAYGRWIPLALWASILFLPGPVSAQPQPFEPGRQDTGLYVGASVGGYSEAAEGYTDATVAGSVLVGVGRADWSLRVEIGRTGEHCVPGCHSHGLLNIGVARRFGTGRARPYVTFGCCLVHAGAGAEIQIGRKLWLAPGLDLNWAVEAASTRPKVALLLRF